MNYMTAFHEACSPGVIPSKAAFRADFDARSKVLMIRVAGRLSDASLAALYAVSRKLSATTGAKMAIADFSLVATFDLSAQGIKDLASQPGMIEPRIMIAPQVCLYGLLRMFQGLRSGRGASGCFPTRFRKSIASAPSEATCRLM